MRNAARIRSRVNHEAKVHSLARHPNIVQLMAVSYAKNSIYLVSEYIDGQNLEDLIFNDGDSYLSSCNKASIAKQVSQAVAYLHNLHPSIVHKDIKPANVVIAQHTHIAKLYDMGLSKLKSSHSVSISEGTVTGTPTYMAPECLVSNKTATLESDVWSLACTLLELYSEKEVWEAEVADKDPTAAIICSMKKRKPPQSLQYLDDSLDESNHSVKVIITDCFNYNTDKRPRAIVILNTFSCSDLSQW